MLETLSLIKVLLPAVVSFVVGILITPFCSNFFYKHKLWKRKARKIGAPHIRDEKGAMHPNAVSVEFQRITNAEEEVRTPRVGGSIIWLSVFITTGVFFLLFVLFPNTLTAKLEFLSINQTFLPLLALISGALIGLVNDMLDVRQNTGRFADGFPRNYFIGIVTLFGLLGGWWFLVKLDMTSIAVPFTDMALELGWAFIPFFVIVTLGTFSSGVIDGIDGLSGGVFALIFAGLATIAFFQNQIDVAALCAVISGATLAFLWFNIPPARFWMGETGMLALTFTLVTVVFLTDTVLLLPIIGAPLVVTSLSSFVQILSKKIRGPEGKIFKVAPLHHHFEAVGWSREKIVMRYWLISIICVIAGVIIALL